MIQGGGEMLGKPLAKSHRRIVGPDFYVENRTLLYSSNLSVQWTIPMEKHWEGCYNVACIFFV